MSRWFVLLCCVCLFSAFSAWAAAEDAAELAPLPTTQPATHVALTEDALVLLVAHEAANQVSFWDVVSGKPLGETTCPAPRFILCRGDNAYVANYGKGSISVLNIAQRKLTDELAVGEKNVCFLSAPAGGHFDGRLLASCVEKDNRSVHLVTVKTDTHRKLRSYRALAAAVVDARGRQVVEVSSEPNQEEALGVYRYEDYVAGGKNRIGVGYVPHLFSAHNFYSVRQIPGSPLWICGDGIRAGVPLAPLWRGFGTATVMTDAKAPIIYSYGHLNEPTLEAFGAQIALPSLGKRALPAAAPGKAKVATGMPAEWPVAVTLDDRLIICGIYQGRAMRCSMPAFASATPQRAASRPGPEPVPAGGGGQAGLPKTIIAGKSLTLRLAGPPDAQWSMKKGPAGATVAADGTLKWTPGVDQLGFHEFKIVSLRGDDIATLAWQPQVVQEETAKLMGTAEITPPTLGRHPIVQAPFQLTAGLGGSILLLQADYLRILDHHGLTVQRQHVLDEVYLRIYERQDYYVALGVSFVDLLRKDTLGPLKRIALPWAAPWDMVVHPQSKTAYVTVDIPAPNEGPKGRKLVTLTINETSGQVVARNDKCAGRVIVMDPKGRYMFARYLEQDMGPPNIPWMGRRLFGGGFARYACSAGLAKDQEYADLSQSLLGCNFSPDGQYLGLFHFEGRFPAKNPAAMIFAPGEMQTPKRLLEIPRRGSWEDLAMTSVDFHPSLPIVVVSTRTFPWLFDLNTGQPLPDRIDVADRPGAIIQALFSPSGERLLLACEEKCVLSLPLKLTEAEQAIVAKRRTAPAQAASSRPAPATQPAGAP